MCPQPVVVNMQKATALTYAGEQRGGAAASAWARSGSAAVVDGAELLAEEGRGGEGLNGGLLLLCAAPGPAGEAGGDFGDDGEEGGAGPGDGRLEDLTPAGGDAGGGEEKRRGADGPVPDVPHAWNIGGAPRREQGGVRRRGRGQRRGRQQCARRRSRG